MTAFHRENCATCEALTLHYKARCVHCGTRMESDEPRQARQYVRYNNVRVTANLERRARKKADREAQGWVTRIQPKQDTSRRHTLHDTGRGRSYR